MPAPSKTHQELIEENTLLKQRIQQLEQSEAQVRIVEAELRDSEKKYRRITENMSDVVTEIDTQGVIKYVSPSHRGIFAENPEDLIGRSVFDLVHPADRDLVAFSFAEAIRTKTDGTSEYRYRHTDGHYIWLRSSGHSFYNAAGEFIGAIINSSDITDRKLAEESLRNSYRRLDDIIDFLPDATLVIDCDGKVITWNRSMELMTGSSKADMIGRGNYEYAIPFYGQRRPLLIDRALLPDEVFEQNHYENVSRQGDTLYAEAYVPQIYKGKGAFMWGTASRLRDASGNIIGAIESIRDITERKRAEDALRESEEMYLRLVNTIPDVIVHTDLRGNVLFANKRLLQASGYSWEEIKGKNVLMYIPPEERKELMQNEIFTPKSTGEPHEYHLISKDGRKVPFELSGDVFLKADGTPSGFVIVGRDITDRKRVEEEREKLQEQLNQAQKMESVGRLAGGVAHDFNNMLGVIAGHSELAMMKADPAQPLYKDLQEIQKAAERSANLTRQLLAFARKQTVTPKVLDLNEVVEGMLKMLRRLIGEDIDLVWLPDSTMSLVKMDPSQIDQILANLCVNARDAIGGVGKVTIETGDRVFDEAYCTNHPEVVPGEYVLLAVSDDGSGMDKDTLNKLFEPFFTTKSMDKGTGLGLATVYGIVKQNKGVIDVYSELGQGTTFSIYLPRHVGKTEQAWKDNREASDNRGNETILLVEDEPAILEMAAIMLEHLGYTVLNAGTPGEAIRIAEDHRGNIHLLMTDVVMPEMNGRELARKILTLYPNIKRLFMSGYTADVIAHQGVLDEGVHFIQKPFSVKGLADKVRETLG